MTRPVASTNAVRVHRTGPAEELVFEVVPKPEPGEGQVRIEVHLAGVNYPDLLLRAGRLAARTLPFTPGVDVAGVVDAVGPGVHGIAIGARVVAALFAEAHGGYAEHVVTAASSVTVLPREIGYEEAIALPVQGVTALLALRVGGLLAAGDTVFVPAAAGGVGHLAVQLAKRLGARVVAGASTRERRQLALDLGADFAVDYARPSWSDELRAATGGADVVLEAGGAAMVDESLRALAPGGRLVVFGAEDAVNPPALTSDRTRQLLREGQSFTGFSLLRQPESARRAALSELFDLVSARSLRVLVDRFPLEDAARAHAAMEGRTTRGKVVLVTRARDEASPRALLGKFVDALKAFSADALADLFSADAVYEFPFLNPSRPERYEGRDAIRAGFRSVWLPGRVRIDDVRVVVHDTSDPEIVIAEGELDATLAEADRRFDSRFVLVARVRGGRIVHLRDYMDAIRVARAMGRLPELAATFEGTR